MKNIPLYEVEKIKNMKEMISLSEKKYGNKAAFLSKPNGSREYVPISYTKYKNDIDAFGTKLIEMGYKNQRIVIIGENRYEWSVSYLAVLNGVGIVVPLDKELPENEIITSVIRSEATVLIYSPKLEEKILKCIDKLTMIKQFIVMDEKTTLTEKNVVPFYELLESGHKLLEEGNNEYLNAEIDNEGMSILLFTSGTTDISKAVMLSHRNIAENLMAMCSMLYIDDKDIFLSLLPIHHTYECTCGFLCQMYRGSTVAYCEGLRYITQNMKEAKATMVLGVPLIFESMYKKIWETIEKNGLSGKVKFAIKLNNFLKIFGVDKSKKLFGKIHENFGGYIRMFISGAAGIDPMVSKGFRNLGILIVQGYGLTECAPIAALNRDCDYKDNAAGLPLPGCDIRIVDKNNEGIGEIIIKGPNVMLGYYKDEVSTKKVIDDEGFFHSGDLGFIDSDGFIHITGRKKNVIVTKNGKNIFPEEIEYLLQKSPYIEEVVVYGDEEEEVGETIVKAIVFPAFDKIKEDFAAGIINSDNVDAVVRDEIKKNNKQLVAYKAIKDFSIRDTEFTKTSTKKIKRYVQENKK